MIELETLKKTLLQGRYFINCVYKMHLLADERRVVYPKVLTKQEIRTSYNSTVSMSSKSILYCV